jgi:hypothetical protein
MPTQEPTRESDEWDKAMSIAKEYALEVIEKLKK